MEEVILIKEEFSSKLKISIWERIQHKGKTSGLLRHRQQKINANNKITNSSKIMMISMISKKYRILDNSSSNLDPKQWNKTIRKRGMNPNQMKIYSLKCRIHSSKSKWMKFNMLMEVKERKRRRRKRRR